MSEHVRFITVFTNVLWVGADIFFVCCLLWWFKDSDDGGRIR